jgi:hypothetical protein
LDREEAEDQEETAMAENCPKNGSHHYSPSDHQQASALHQIDRQTSE